MKVAICVIAKNEGAFLQEWIEYHRLLGVDHFYIYDNNSSDNSHAVYRLYADVLTVKHWPDGDNQQRAAYQHFALHHGAAFDWTAFIDADEFIACKRGCNLKEWLSTYSHEVALMLDWRIFCTNGHALRPPGFVIENFTRAHSISPQPNVKTICRADQIVTDRILSPHRFAYLDGRQALAVPSDDIAIYHYILRSREDLIMKVARGDAWDAAKSQQRRQHLMPIVEEKLQKYDNGDLVDHHMLQYVPALRERIARLS